MEREQYAIMAQREDRHWWYAGMRRAALDLLRSALGERSNLNLLDAGCGTGGTTIRLREFGTVTGVDLAWDAVAPASARGLAGHVAQASIERLPFADATFDAATSFEVVYHLGVGDDLHALRELRRVLRPDGVLLLRLPAHDWLRGAHDRLVHTRHRYTRSEVRDKLARAGFRTQRLSWANSALLAPAIAKRLLERPNGHASDEPDLWQPPGPINAVLENLVAVEGLALPRMSLPFGLSVIALARAT